MESNAEKCHVIKFEKVQKGLFWYYKHGSISLQISDRQKDLVVANGRLSPGDHINEKK